MTAKVHVKLVVSDIEASRGFYAKLFGSEPVKVKPGYVKFLPEAVPVNLALFEAADGVSLGTPSHLGIQLESTEEVQGQLQRVKSCGLPVREEMGVNCCHANQDKFWVEDPDGLQWEVYKLNYDIEDETIPQKHMSPPAVLQMAPGGVSSDACCQE